VKKENIEKKPFMNIHETRDSKLIMRFITLTLTGKILQVNKRESYLSSFGKQATKSCFGLKAL